MTISAAIKIKLYKTFDKMRDQLDELEEVMGRGAKAATHDTDTPAFEVMEIIDRLREKLYRTCDKMLDQLDDLEKR